MPFLFFLLKKTGADSAAPGSGITSSECASWYRMGCFFTPSPLLLKVDNYSDIAAIDEEDASLFFIIFRNLRFADKGLCL